MKIALSLLLSATLAVAGCTPKGENFIVVTDQSNVSPKGSGTGPAPRVTGIRPDNVPPAAQAESFARNFLNSIQAPSIRAKREFCGFFFVDSGGQIQATPPRRGTFASCSLPVPSRGQGVFASYHTHGAYGPDYDNEVPSPTDMQSDFALGLDGYISTPGGRVWRIHLQDRTARQVCGLRCVLQDPGFVPRNEESVRQAYTLASLNQRVQ